MAEERSRAQPQSDLLLTQLPARKRQTEKLSRAAPRFRQLGPVVAPPDGTLQLTETPTITTDYRLATPQAAAAYVRIKVMPVVTLSAPATTTVLQGTITPTLSG